MAGIGRSWGKIKKKRNRYFPSYVHPEDILKVRHTPARAFTTRMYAEAWLAAEHRMIELGVWVAPEERRKQQEAEGITVRQWLEEYHRILQRPPHSVTESTAQQYQKIVCLRLLDVQSAGALDPRVTRLADMPISQVTKTDAHLKWDRICDDGQ